LPLFSAIAKLNRTTIYAARLVDDFNNPNLMRFGTPYPGPIRSAPGPMKVAAYADMKQSAAGVRSSWDAAHYYMDKTMHRRDELLAKYAVERENESIAAIAETATIPTTDPSTATI
jgi:hypothetical protein